MAVCQLVPRPPTFAALTTASDAPGGWPSATLAVAEQLRAGQSPAVLVLYERPGGQRRCVLARDIPVSPSTSPTLAARALYGLPT